jgi:hypothetical protein
MADTFVGWSRLLVPASLAIGGMMWLVGCDNMVIAPENEDPVDADAPALDARPRIGPAEDVRRVFVTSITYGGDLGGVSGADARCDAVAVSAGIDGTWHAWLGASDASPASRLEHADVPYERLDGVRIADDWEDLTDGTLAAPIVIDERGEVIADSTDFVWTAADEAGAFDGFGTCVDWTNTDAGGFLGDLTATDHNWAHVGCQPCTEFAHLYCFEE